MLTVIVLVRNEAKTLPACLSSLKFAQHILVIDDNSTDSSSRIAASFHARIITRPLKGDFSAQRNFALSRVTTPWALFVDADEVVSLQLAREISQFISVTSNIAARIPRIDYLWDRQLHYGDLKGFTVLRLGRVGQGTWVGKVHETWRFTGPVSSLSSPLYHTPHPSLVEFIGHINTYSSLRAAELHAQGTPPSLLKIIFYPPVKFFYLYLFRLGFLDREPGFIHACLMSFNSFLVQGKLYLLSRGIS